MKLNLVALSNSKINVQNRIYGNMKGVTKACKNVKSQVNQTKYE